MKSAHIYLGKLHDTSADMLEAVCRNDYTVNLKIFVKSSLDGRWFNIICDYNWVMTSLFIIIAYPTHLHSHSKVYRK